VGTWALRGVIPLAQGVPQITALGSCLGKDIVFRFIIEYSILRDFGPLGNNNRSIFLYEDF